MTSYVLASDPAFRTITHGYNAYAAGCRCQVCREAKTAYVRSRRAAAKRGELDGNFTHGTRYGYEQYHCRCGPCAERHRAAQRPGYQARPNQRLDRIREYLSSGCDRMTIAAAAERLGVSQKTITNYRKYLREATT